MRSLVTVALLFTLGGLSACEKATPTNSGQPQLASSAAADSAAPTADTRSDPQMVADYAQWARSAEVQLKAADDDYLAAVRSAVKNSSSEMMRQALDGYQNAIDAAYWQDQPVHPHLNVCDADASSALDAAEDAIKSGYEARGLIVKGTEGGSGGGNPTMAQVASVNINTEDIATADRALRASLAKAKGAARSPQQIAASCM